MNEKEKHYSKIYLFVIGLLALLVGYLIWQSGNVSNNRGGADAVRAEFNRAGELLGGSIEIARRAELGIERAETAITDSIERVERIESRNSEIEGGIRESLGINRESQSIIQRVRKRGQENSE